MHQKVMLLSRGTSTRWRDRAAGTSWGSTRRSAMSCTRGRTTPDSRTCWGDTQQLVREGLGSVGGHQGDCEPTQEPVAERGCLGDTQNSTRGGPGQPAVAELALGRVPASPFTLPQLETSF